MNLGREFYEIVASMMTKSAIKRARKRVKVAVCIIEGCCAPQKQGGRGLCKLHWNQFDYARRLASRRGMAALRRFEREEIEAGRVAPSRRGQWSCNCFVEKARS
jgi:hypothetical protein